MSRIRYVMSGEDIRVDRLKLNQQNIDLTKAKENAGKFDNSAKITNENLSVFEAQVDNNICSISLVKLDNKKTTGIENMGF